jgi:hypothetical protein
MTNDECLINDETRMTKTQAALDHSIGSFELRHSSFFSHFIHH